MPRKPTGKRQIAVTDPEGPGAWATRHLEWMRTTRTRT